DVLRSQSIHTPALKGSALALRPLCNAHTPLKEIPERPSAVRRKRRAFDRHVVLRLRSAAQVDDTCRSPRSVKTAAPAPRIASFPTTKPSTPASPPPSPWRIAS